MGISVVGNGGGTVGISVVGNGGGAVDLSVGGDGGGTVDLSVGGFVAATEVCAVGVVGRAQAISPWGHVYLNSAFPGGPHLPCQDPPFPQQVMSPLLVRPHLGHPDQKIISLCL